MNLSQRHYDIHEEVLTEPRGARAAEDTHRPGGCSGRPSGPREIRLGKFRRRPPRARRGRHLHDHDRVRSRGTRELCGTTFKGLPDDVKPGDFLLIDDWARVKVARARHRRRARAHRGPVLGGSRVPRVSNKQGHQFLPGVAVNVPALSEKDEDDLRWALRAGLAPPPPPPPPPPPRLHRAVVSVRNARRHHARARDHVREEGHPSLPVIAKIGRSREARRRPLESIVERPSDGIHLVARGDRSGSSCPSKRWPTSCRKRAVELARRMAKPVIVATQMLESMIRQPRFSDACRRPSDRPPTPYSTGPTRVCSVER